SALLGTAPVPLVYLAGRELVSKRAALVAALLVTVNPLIVWYSQETRSYALLMLLTTVSLLFFVRALRAPAGAGGRDVVGWAIASALALATHYFALFVVLPQLAWLVYARRELRHVKITAAAILAVSAGAIAFGLVQRHHGLHNWIAETGLAGRVAEIPGLFLIGFETPSPVLLAAIAVSCAAVALWLLATRGEANDRAGAVLAGAVAVVAVALPSLLSLVGLDYLVYKNVIAALVPSLIVLAAGFAAPRAGAVGAVPLALLCALSLGVLAVTADEPKYRREDWRAVAEALGPARVDRAIVATPREPARQPLELYLGADPMPKGGAAVRELVLVAGARRELGSTANPKV